MNSDVGFFHIFKFVYNLVSFSNKIFLGKIMVKKAQIMDSQTMNRTIARISHEILERNQGAENICILGVKRRGVPFAKMVCNNIKLFEGISVPFGEIDITYQRDDFDEQKKKQVATDSIIPTDIENKTVIIVDDVLYTGRTAKASIETVFKFGRPSSVQFVVLIDRGHRELPIRPDYVGKNVPTSKQEKVVVMFDELDNESGVFICE